MRIEPARLWRNNHARREGLGEVGEVVSYSVIHQGLTHLNEHTPYVVALVRLTNKTMMSQMVDVVLSEIRIGMKVRGVLRKMFEVDADALHVYGVKFSPLDEENNS